MWHRNDRVTRERFEREVLPYLDGAYNLARWLTKNDDDGADVVQESCMKAFQALGSAGPTSKAWFLTIVRNTAHSLLRRNRREKRLEDEIETLAWDGPSPEQSLLSNLNQEILTAFLEELPAELREVVVLRELEDLSYREIAEVTGKPIGTVMSRLSRARQRLQQRASDRTPEEWQLGL